MLNKHSNVNSEKTYIGNDVYINFETVFLDCSKITIGKIMY